MSLFFLSFDSTLLDAFLISDCLIKGHLPHHHKPAGGCIAPGIFHVGELTGCWQPLSPASQCTQALLAGTCLCEAALFVSCVCLFTCRVGTRPGSSQTVQVCLNTGSRLSQAASLCGGLHAKHKAGRCQHCVTAAWTMGLVLTFFLWFIHCGKTKPGDPGVYTGFNPPFNYSY